MKRVEKFTREKGLEDKIDLFRKGALLAQSQKGFETMAELSESEKELLRRETTRQSCSLPFLFYHYPCTRTQTQHF